MKRATVWLVLVALLITVTAVGCGPTPTPQVIKETVVVEVTKEVVVTATPAPEEQPTGHLSVLGGATEEYVDAICKAFEAKTGIKTSWVRMSSGEAWARIEAEKGNPSFSVWWGGPADGYIAAAEAGLLEPYVSTSAAKIPDQYKSPAGYWTGVYVGALGFGTNEDYLKEHNLEAPQSWADLLKPEWKDQVAMAHPGTSGTAYTALATILQVMGEEEGWEYLSNLHGQIYHYTKSGRGPVRMVGGGEVAVGIVFAHDFVAAIEEGYPIEITFPSEGTGYEIGGVALIEGAKEPVEAKMFIDFTLSAECQNIGKTVRAYQFLTNPGATPPEIVPYSLSDLAMVKYDFQWAGGHKKEFVDKFTKEIEPSVPTE